MNPKLRNLLTQIEQRLSNLDIDGFKIGITGLELDERLQKVDYKGHYHTIVPIAGGSNSDIVNAEIYAFDYFDGKKGCENETPGGGNTGKADKLYMVVRFKFSKPPTIEEIQVIHCDFIRNYQPVQL